MFYTFREMNTILKHALKVKGFTPVNQLCERLCLNLNTVYKWMSDKNRYLSPETADALLSYLRANEPDRLVVGTAFINI